jgi:hypothetical protein
MMTLKQFRVFNFRSVDDSGPSARWLARAN